MGANIKDIEFFPSNLEFTVFTSDEIKKLSVVKIITGLTFDPLGHPLPGGLYDNVMGTYGRCMEQCLTCLNIYACPGHMGHIELHALVYNPFFIKIVQKMLTISCLKCFKVQIKEHEIEILELQLQLLDAGYIIEAQELEIYKSEIVCANVDIPVKLENGDTTHPRITQLKMLLKRGKAENDFTTKTTCALRHAIINASFQRPSRKKCMHCSAPLRNIRYLNRKLVYYVTKSELKTTNPNMENLSGRNKVILADECLNFLKEIFKNHETLFKLVFPILNVTPTVMSEEFSPIEYFFINVVPVTPPKARPSNVLRDQIVEHQQTAIYRSIIENNNVLRVVLQYLKGQEEILQEEAKNAYNALSGKDSYEKLYNAWQALQSSVDLLLDGAISRDTSTMGLKQVLEKKEGLIRKHMMGKRVNFAARTVITPDPNINVEEVGIPVIFACKLSYPEAVTPWNVTELRKMVMNGPNVHPGANYIQDEKGYTTLIPHDSAAKRESMAKLLYTLPENGTKIVHRHVVNGDILLLNRQPSLHKPSIMAHKARILPGEKTFRMHYSNCKAYNADFDGDEMNAHLPQNEIARSEAYNLVNVANNYLVPKDGTPLGGLIQDHVISGVKLSMRGRLFNKEDYQQLVFQGLAHIRGDIKLLPPTIIKPQMLWSGKQILSTIIINIIPHDLPRINLDSTAKMNPKSWISDIVREPMCGRLKNEIDMTESEVIIRNGELLVGVLDKQQYGATTFGLVHCMYELYGGNVSTNLLTAFTKVFTYFLQREGFTLGVKDILVSGEGDKRRQKIIKECREIGNSAVAEALELTEIPTLDILAEKMEDAYVKNPQFRILLDRKYKKLLDGYTNEINKTCLPAGLITKIPNNNLQLMVLSGAKGSLVNTMQISCLLGQIELEGKRPPLMISGKSLPSFTAFETSPKSGGFIDGRFMTGIQPQDFFFHCMAGREGLIDTAVKTSRSGYLQRCLIKHLEGLSVNYDMTVRDSDNSVVQFLYGEDGLDILKSKFLNSTQGCKFLFKNAPVILQADELKYMRDDTYLKKMSKHTKKINSWVQKNKDRGASKRKTKSAFVQFSDELKDEICIENPNEINEKTGRRRFDESLLELWRLADDTSKEMYRKKYMGCPDPLISIYRQDNYYGSISERMQNLIDAAKLINVDYKNIIPDIMYLKNIKSLVAPGEPVGLLAAQSIGEPSTQMTLNTFHFAGRGEMNVTLGIPRLREILMLASSDIKTPSMDIPIKESQWKSAEKLRIHLNRVTVSDILEFVNVEVKTILQPERAYQYQIRFQFLPRKAYQEDFCVKPKKIVKYMTETFFKNLFRAIMKSAQKNALVVEIEDRKNKNKDADDEDRNYDDGDDNAKNNLKKDKIDESSSEDEQEGNVDDLDAAEIKLKSKNKDDVDYDEPEENEEREDDDQEDEDQEVEEGEDETIDVDNALEANAETDQLAGKVLSNTMIKDFLYDKNDYLWCQLTFNLEMIYKKPNISSIIRELAQKSVIHQVQNIKRAIIYKGDDDKQLLKTDGINIVEMFGYDKILDLNKLYSNDIHAIARTYGIEAASRVIVKEISNVFRVYGIEVDKRHLSLIADYMTFDGSFKPLSRKGMEHSASPLQQMSFESCLQFLKAAATAGKNDDFYSPSSRIMIGLPVKNGTGAFELLNSFD